MSQLEVYHSTIRIKESQGNYLIMHSSKKVLIFIYNAESGKMNSFKDVIARIVSPSTYQCRLCGLTYGVSGMKSKWRDFVNNLGLPVEFLHRDEFLKQYEMKNPEFPSVYLKEDGLIRLLMSKDEIDTLSSLDELMAFVEKRVSQSL